MKMKNTLKIISKLAYVITIICIIIYVALIILPVITQGNATLGGYRIFVVASGSMIPDYDVGDVVICKKVEDTDLKVDDVIIYLGDTGEFDDKVIMHKIVSIGVDENGESFFETKGIANDVEDPQVKYSQIYGKVTTQSNIMTCVYKFFNNIYFSYIIIVLVVINVFVSFIPKRKLLEIAESTKEEPAKEENKTDSNLDNKVQTDADKEDASKDEEYQEKEAKLEVNQDEYIETEDIQYDDEADYQIDVEEDLEDEEDVSSDEEQILEDSQSEVNMDDETKIKLDDNAKVKDKSKEKNKTIRKKLRDHRRNKTKDDESC